MPLGGALTAITAAGGTAGAAGGAGGAGAMANIIPQLGKMAGGGGGSKATTGAASGMVVGAMQMLKAARAKRDAENLQPALYDPQQQAMLSEIQQKARSLNTGSAFAGDMGQIDAITAGTNQAIVQATGGDVSGTIQALLAAQTTAGRAKNGVLGQADDQNRYYSAMAVDLQNKISSRAMELKLAMQDQKKAEWAQGMQNGFSNFAAGAGLSNAAGINWMDVLQSARKGSSAMEPAVNSLGAPSTPSAVNPIQSPALTQMPADDVNVRDIYTNMETGWQQ